MKKIEITVSDETYEMLQLMGDRKRKGSIWLEKDLNGNRRLRFEAYRQTSKRITRILHRTPFGWLGDTAHHVKLTLIAPKSVGWHRAAELLLGDSKESTDVLHQMADSELKNEPLNPEDNV